MTNREYFKDPDDQCRMFLLECCWKDKYYHTFDMLIEKIQWLKSEVSPLAKSVPRCPVCGKLPIENCNGFLVCPTSKCKFNKIKLEEAVNIWQRRCTNGN